MNPNWENEGNDGQDNNTHDPTLLLDDTKLNLLLLY